MTRLFQSVAAALALACAAGGENVFRRSMDRVSSMDPAVAASMYAARAVQFVQFAIGQQQGKQGVSQHRGTQFSGPGPQGRLVPGGR